MKQLFFRNRLHLGAFHVKKAVCARLYARQLFCLLTIISGHLMPQLPQKQAPLIATSFISA